MSLLAAVEGDTDVPVVQKLAADAGLALVDVIDEGGKDQLDLHVRGYNSAAKVARGWCCATWTATSDAREPSSRL